MPYADLYELSHPAVDACVADLLGNFVLKPPSGEPIPTSTKWQIVSSGSTIHIVRQKPGGVLFTVQVRLLPEPERSVTVVTFNSDYAAIDQILPHVGGALRRIIAQHQANLRGLEKIGINPLLNATTGEPLKELRVIADETSHEAAARLLKDFHPTLTSIDVSSNIQPETEMRSPAFQEIKRANPDYTCEEVAVAYNQAYEPDHVNAEAVRYVYRKYIEGGWPGSKKRPKR